MISRAEFYQKHLDLVSRSFAFCIARLTSPLREQVGLSYLICRILDSIEDLAWTSDSEQIEQFQHFELLLLNPFSDSELRAWIARFPEGLTAGERDLIQDAGTIFRDFQELPANVREAIAQPVLSMSRGMRHFARTKAGPHAQLRLRTLKEVNRYCFFVAGVVGEILTRLVGINRGMTAVSKQQLVNAFHFGLFLQKVNLLKDQRADEAQGRFLVPSRPQLLASLGSHARQALAYVTSIPDTLLPFKLFCSWSLFLGLASLPWIEQSYRQNDASKIPRVETETLLSEIESIASDDSKLKEMFEFLFQFVGESGEGQQVASARQENEEQSFPELYQGLLPSDELKAFGLK